MTEPPLLRKLLISATDPDVRLWRNVSSQCWVGRFVLKATEVRRVTLAPGDVVLRGGVSIRAGLCEGSSDLVGIVGPHGRFVGAEVKTKGVVIEDHQRRWLEVVRELGGVAGEVRTESDLKALIEEAKG